MLLQNITHEGVIIGCYAHWSYVHLDQLCYKFNRITKSINERWKVSSNLSKNFYYHILIKRKSIFIQNSVGQPSIAMAGIFETLRYVGQFFLLSSNGIKPSILSTSLDVGERNSKNTLILYPVIIRRHEDFKIHIMPLLRGSHIGLIEWYF